MEIIGYLASILIGISLGLIGGGGSILTVPVLVYLFHVDPVQATAYSLFIVVVRAGRDSSDDPRVYFSVRTVRLWPNLKKVSMSSTDFDPQL
jgi:hypothetical protein